MPSFDVVSEVNEVEVRNALDQANKEIGTRFDFKGTAAAIGHRKSRPGGSPRPAFFNGSGYGAVADGDRVAGGKAGR